MRGSILFLFVALASCTRADTQAAGQAVLAMAVIGPSHAEQEMTKANADACPTGMILVDGMYCPEVEQTCLRWLDPEGPYHHFRCAEYAKPARCKGETKHVRYCIDRTERKESNSNLPRNFMSFTSGKALCEEASARICKESEWVFACEGEEMRPYPYGFERSPALCNVERTQDLGHTGHLRDHRAEVDAHKDCRSPFGVLDQAGNMEEWVAADTPKMGYGEIMMGSWWIASRHTCRSFQIGHRASYAGAETGTRCCKDAAPADSRQMQATRSN